MEGGGRLTLKVRKEPMHGNRAKLTVLIVAKSMSFLWDSTGYHMGGKSCVEWKNVLPCWGFTTTRGTLLNPASFATKLTLRTWKCGSSLARKLEVIFASMTPTHITPTVGTLLPREIVLITASTFKAYP